jgi:hypothetical protein
MEEVEEVLRMDMEAARAPASSITIAVGSTA